MKSQGNPPKLKFYIRNLFDFIEPDFNMHAINKRLTINKPNFFLEKNQFYLLLHRTETDKI